MPYRWSTVENGEVFVDEFEEAEDVLCEECGAFTESGGFTDGDHEFCEDCYDNIFGKD